MSRDFVRDTVRNQIASTLEGAFFQYFRYKPSPAEVNSWRNSLRAMAQVVDYAELNDNGVLLEYQLPLSSKRLDCLICGQDMFDVARAVIVELKQWDRCESSDVDKVVVSWVGGRTREVLHPSVQVGQYQQYLEDSHTAFHEPPAPIQLSACSYLHNYAVEDDDPILAAKFEAYLRDYPLFSQDDTDALSSYLKAYLAGGNGRPVLDRIERSRYRPSRKLMDHVADAIRARPPWVLLDEQLVVYEKILSTVHQRLGDRKKQVVIIRGGPGTGKSVIAINLLAKLLRDGVNAHYATGSRAFTETLWSLLGSRSRVMFRYFNSYGDAEPNSIDVLVCDESHRIRETSNSRFTSAARRRTMPQLHEIIGASKTSVFLIDDRQVVRPNEIGSSEYIRKQAGVLGADVSDYELDVQFRCAGSQGFLNWVNNTLGIERTANVLWDGAEGFDFRIFDSPEALESAIRAKASSGFSARVAAGFCWPWSPPQPDGTLVEDVVIGEYRRPWDAKPGNWKLAPGIPSASLWATDPHGIDQVGCVYNIQGFELDYIGVIWGRDLVYSFDAQSWVGNKQESADQVVKRSKEQFVDLVKNTYRVLVSRGMKGCFVHFMDRDTERFVRSRMELTTVPKGLRIVHPGPTDRYTTCVPLVPLRIAAGGFSDPQRSDGEWEWIQPDAKHRLHPGMFVAQVIGRSMEPAIPDGSYCLFASPIVGTREGKTVLAQLQDAVDPETGERFTVKRYSSEKVLAGDSWRHTRVTLRPINPDFEPIVLTVADEGLVAVIAECIEVLDVHRATGDLEK
jgi:uncharacterized protein